MRTVRAQVLPQAGPQRADFRAANGSDLSIFEGIAKSVSTRSREEPDLGEQCAAVTPAGEEGEGGSEGVSFYSHASPSIPTNSPSIFPLLMGSELGKRPGAWCLVPGNWCLVPGDW